MTNISTQKNRSLVQMALFGAIIVLLAFTPFIGYIPLGFTKATIIHIPVILASLLLGPKKGAILGALFGLTSLISNTFQPTPTSFVFSPLYSLGDTHGGFTSLIICFVPRILVGVVPYFVFKLVQKIAKGKKGSETIALVFAGLAGSLTNTLLVMNGIYLFFGESYAQARNTAADAVYGLILSVIGINGVPEAIVAAILTVAIGKVLLKLKKKSY